MGKRSAQKDFYAGGFLYNPKTRSVLLHLRDDKTSFDPDRWAFFGGSRENTETPVECFMRELKEETGVAVFSDQVVPLCDYFNEDHGQRRYVFYVKKYVPEEDIILGEGRGFEWVSLKKVFEYDLTEKTRKDLKKFLEHEK